jgi:hypothetical protein
MHRFPLFYNQVLISTILSLSATAIYAEVSARGNEQTNAAGKAVVNKTITPAQAMTPELLAKQSPVVWKLHAEQWELARSGETILSLPVLNQVVRAWLAEKQKMIEIRYPGGEDGELWVQQLTDWLVSLGIPSKYLVTTPGSGADDVIKFNIVK